MRVRTAYVVAGLLLLALVASLSGQDRIADLRARFEHETNPIQKAKQMPELGEAEFQRIREAVEGDRGPIALKGLQEYQAQVDTCVKGLDGLKIDAAKHPSGYKQLQISVQESLRRIDALLPPMTSDEQAPFLEIRKSLDDVNRRLIEQLFPQQTPPKPDRLVQ